MRDIHGRYRNTKAIGDLAPAWAQGCPSCQFGIVVAPDIIAAFPLYEGRAVQAHEEMIAFCACTAGHLYRQHLRRVYNGLSMETRRLVLEHINAATPTVHS